MLAARPRTEAEIRARLARDGLAEEASGVVEWLGRLGYLDDAAYARARAASLLRGGRTGPRLAERRLVAAGVAPALARQAVAEGMDAEGVGGARPLDEAARCRALAERRARKPIASLDDRERGRLARFLAGRGYSPAAVASALGVYVDDAGDR